MFGHFNQLPSLTPIEREYKDLMIQIAEIQHACQRNSEKYIHYRDSSYEHPLTAGYNISLMTENDKLIEQQKLLITKAKQLKKKIPENKARALYQEAWQEVLLSKDGFFLQALKEIEEKKEKKKKKEKKPEEKKEDLFVLDIAEKMAPDISDVEMSTSTFGQPRSQKKR